MSKSSQKWFKKVRGSYVPNSWQGWVAYLPYISYLLVSYLYIMYNFGYSIMSLLIIIPNWVAAAVVMTWVAKSKS